MHKGCRFYDPLVRVPLVVSWPRRLAGGVVAEALVELVDLAPPLLELGGVDALELPDSHAALEGAFPIEWMASRATSILGGTEDIQRNIIAERIFGLPRGN